MNGISNKITFTSRNHVIRRADDIARLVAREYPMLSATKYAGSPNCMQHADSIRNLMKKITTARNYICRIKANYELLPEEKIRQYMDSVEKYGIGNCAEMTDTATIIAYMHNLKDTCKVMLQTNVCRDLDHVALCVKDAKNPYIIDAWLGFADYIPNALEKYKTIYKNYFMFSKVKEEKIEFREYPYNPIKKALDNVSNIELYRLKKEFLWNKKY